MLRLIDMVTILNGKLSRIEELTKNHPGNYGAVINIVESVIWARAILEVLDKYNIDLKKYGYAVEREIGFETYEKISTRKLFGYILHPRYFTLGFDKSGEGHIEIKSDSSKRHTVSYSDFIKVMGSLVLPKQFTALAVCDMSEKFFKSFSLGDMEYAEGGNFIPVDIELHWLLNYYVKYNIPLKREIIEKIYNINIPNEILLGLFFYRGTLREVNEGLDMKVGFGPPWEDGQDVFSPFFNPKLLFDIIRKNIKDSHSSPPHV